MYRAGCQRAGVDDPGAGGLVRTGMFVRLLGGVFILIERVEQNGRTTAPLCAAMQVLDSVWEGRSHE